MAPAKISQVLPANSERPYTDAEFDHLLEGIEDERPYTEAEFNHLLEGIEDEDNKDALEKKEEATENLEDNIEEMEEDATENPELPVKALYTRAEAEIDELLKELEEEAAKETLEKVDKPGPEDPEAARVRKLWNTLRNPWNPEAQRNLEAQVQAQIQADHLACQEFLQELTHLALQDNGTRLDMLKLLLTEKNGRSRVSHLVWDYPAVAKAIRGEGRPSQIWEEIMAAHRK